MSTHATIIVKNRFTNKYDYIYLHSDGYPDHALTTLKSFYNNYNSAQTLVDLGDCSSLSEMCNKPETLSFDNRISGFCVFYGRDRGEVGTEKQTTDDLNYRKKFQQYTYLFDTEWTQL